MFRITIDNEEVLCDKDITIKEEMLNTPSVILNNVYPKTWEASKDYTTNFYHPDDYSKCVIADQDYIAQSDGTTVEGTNLQVNYDDRRNFEYYLKGDTYQYTTPTPDSPQEVVNATGRQEISVCGKNFLNIKGIVKGRLDNGVLGYENNTPVLTLNDNSFSFTTNANWRGVTSDYIPIDTTSSTSMRISYNNLNSEFAVSVACYDENKTWISNATISGNASNKYRQISLVNGTKFIRIYFSLASSGSITITNPMLEVGTTVSTYEAYKGGVYEINLGKNLFDYTTNIVYNAWFNNSNMKIQTDNNANVSYIKCEPNTTYTISRRNPITTRFHVATTEVTPAVGVSILSFNYDNSATSITVTTPSNANYLVVRFVYNEKSDYETYAKTIQIERGSVATTYSPYKTQIELCKIGNYQDFIRKGTGKNLLDISQTQIGKAWNGDSNSARAVCYVECKPNTTYTASITGNGTLDAVYYFGKTNKTDTTVTMSTAQITTSRTFTTTENTNYIGIQFNKSSITQTNVESANVMIEESSTASVYEPYGYKDKWYLYKTIGKIVLGNASSLTSATIFGVSAQYTSFYINDSINEGRNYNFYSDRIKKANEQYSQYAGYRNAQNLFVLTDTSDTLANFNSKISGSLVYYVLSTPYTMEITDSELLGQLNAINLLTGLNNISVSSPYRQAIMNLHYNFNDAYYYTNELYFCGVVKNSGNISLNPREPHFQTLQILDFKTFLSEGETLDRVIVDKTILETIQEVVGVISGYGFVLGNVQIANPNEIIGAYSTENKTAYDIFNYIAEITQSKWTTRLVDENTVAIDFYDPSALPQGTPIEYNTTYFKNNQIDNMFYSYSANDYRNKQIMTSKEVFANIDTKETIISSGYGSNFLLQQPVGQVESITLNNVEMSFATKQDKELGYSADFYYSVGSESIESDINIPLGSAIVVQYIPIVAGRQVIANDSEISRISGATGRNGIITRYENRNDASTSNELQMIGQSYIKYKGSPEIKLTVETRSNLWKIGDRVQFNAPIPELATEYMVKSKQIEYIKTIDDVFYTFEMSSSFNSEQDINYFDNQRAKALGNIKEGSYISRNIDIENVANIVFQNATLEKINSTGDNKLNSTLNSPLVQ